MISPRNFRLAGAALSVVLFASAAAYAAKTFRHSDTHITKKAPREVEAILRDYSNYCDSGCKYTRPDLKKIILLDYQRSNESWYTWTHVDSTFKDVKYFTHVKISRKADGSFKWHGEQVTDESLLKALEAKTGLENAPVFDSGTTDISVEASGEGSKFTQTVVITVSGFIANFPSKIEASMRKSFEQTFKNLDR